MNHFWHSVGLMAELSLREAVRKKLVAVLLILSALFLGFYLYGVFRIDDEINQRALEAGIERSRTGLANAPVIYSTMLGMYLVYFLGSLMSVLSTVGAVSADVETGVLQSVIARPVSRSGLVAGRWLGFSVVNVGYVLLLAAGLLGGVWAITGYLPAEFLPAVLLIMLAALLLTGLTVLGSTLFSTLANGIGVFVLYGVGFSGGVLSMIGKISDNDTVSTLGRVANTLMPTNALWLGASYHLQPDLMRQMNEAVPNPIFGNAPVPTGMVLWAIALTLLAVGGGMWRLSRRDL